MSTPEGFITAAQLVRQYRTMLFDFSKAGPGIVKHFTGKDPTCQRGCAHCCYQKIVMSVSDGLLVYLHLHSRWSPALERRLIEADRAMTLASHDEWALERRPCVFLDEQERGRGACTIYPVRPVACAATYSITEDPRACGVSGGHAQLQIAGPDARDAFGVLHADIAKSLGHDRTWCATLPGAVLCGRSLAGGQAMPLYVHRIALEDAERAGVTVEHLFDRTGPRRAARLAELLATAAKSLDDPSRGAVAPSLGEPRGTERGPR